MLLCGTPLVLYSTRWLLPGELWLMVGERKKKQKQKRKEKKETGVMAG